MNDGVTVICAVWHGDPNRQSLLRTHQANLDNLTVPVERVYVFDGGDVPQPGLAGTVMTVSEKLSIYQAWNVALSLVATPYVMNLNLDDRLAPDAVEKMRRVLNAYAEGFIIGGDWQICYTQEETDKVLPCFPIQDLPFLPEWPPASRSVTRLGSGDGKRGTLGPACMWRMSAHVGMPRFPWRFNDNTRIQVIGDSIWWSLIQQQLKKRIIRLPVVIGNYSSHPDDQAEFRSSASDEHAKYQIGGVSLL